MRSGVVIAAALLVAIGPGFDQALSWTAIGQEPAVERRDLAAFPPEASPAALEEIERRLRDDVAYLASDELEGRGPYSKGQDLAVEFVAKRFAELRLEPMFGPSYFQPFAERPHLVPASNAAIEIEGERDGAASLVAGREWLPLHHGDASIEEAPLAFVGFGISAPEHEYDDYAELDVRGKAVVVLRHEPRSDDPAYFDGSRISEHGLLARKAALARERGAVAVVFVTDAHSLRSGKGERSDSLVSTAAAAKIDARGLAIVHVLREHAAEWFPAEGEGSLAAIEVKIHESRAPASIQDLDRSLSVRGGLAKTTQAMRNVVAKLDGVGPLKDQALVVGAHVDHVGRGEFGSLAIWTRDIHNGADDNASGTSTLLEAARRFSEFAQTQPETPRRTTLFIAFTGEEMGLLGSEHFVSRSPVAAERLSAMINFDMVGRYRNRLVLSGYDTSPAFAPLLKAGEAKTQLKFEYESGGYGPSDHASFYATGTPVLHFFTGLHRQYHRPDDDVETLNYPDMARIADYSSRLIWELASCETEIARSRSAGIEGALVGPDEPAASGASLRQGAPVLGVTLDQRAALGNGAAGYPVANVLAINPSAAAALRKGDVIVEFAGEPIADPNRLPKAIAERRRGERVRVVLVRNGERLAFDVTLR